MGLVGLVGLVSPLFFNRAHTLYGQVESMRELESSQVIRRVYTICSAHQHRLRSDCPVQILCLASADIGLAFTRTKDVEGGVSHSGRCFVP